MWPSFAGISGSKTKSITVARPRTSGGFAAPVALSGRRGLTGSIGSGRRTATGPSTLQCHRCSRTRSRAGGAMSRAKRWFICMPIFHPWLARRKSEIPRTEGGRRGREEWSPFWGLGEAGERREAMGVCERETFRKLLWVRQLLTGNSRGVLCRACVCDEARSAERWQPGRERPPLPPPGPGPGPCREGVAHAPAACLVRPDRRDRALVVDTTQCLVAQRDARSSRTAPRDGCPPLQLLPDRRVLCH